MPKGVYTHKPNTKEQNLKISLKLKGIKKEPLSQETKDKISKSKRGKTRKHKSGLRNKNHRIRNSVNYLLWRKSCFERDNFTCQKTGQNGGDLNVHHINNFSEFIELRFAIDNGITLSKKAHEEFHKMYGYKNNTKEQLEDFLNNK